MRSLIWLRPSSNRVIRLSVGVSLPITLVRLTRSHQRAHRKSLFEASRVVCWPPFSQKNYWTLLLSKIGQAERAKFRDLFFAFLVVVATIFFPFTTRIVKLIKRKIGGSVKKFKLEFSCRRNMISPGLFHWIAPNGYGLKDLSPLQKFGVKVIYEHFNWWHNKWGKGRGPTWAIIGIWRLNALTYTLATILNKIESGYSSFWFTNLWSFDQTDPTQDWGLSWDDTFTNRLDCNK